MAIYEYVCQECGAKFTEHRKVADRDNPATCPECGSDGPERIKFHATDHILKGQGWARDGYRNKVKGDR